MRHAGRGDLVLGALAPDLARDTSLTGRAQALAATFERAGVPCVVSAAIEADLWCKLTINCVYNAISAVGDADYGRILAHGATCALVPSIVAECVAVARADGVALDEAALLQAALAVGTAMATQISSTAQDIRRGRRTEIDALNGYVAERGAALGVPALFHTGQTGIGAGMPGGRGLRLKHSDPMLLDDVAADFPDLTIVMAHPSFPWQEEALAVATHKANVFIDLSGWSPKYFPPQLVQYANTLLRDRILFGSDFPLITPDRWLKDFAEAGFKPEVQPGILKGNAMRLLGLPGAVTADEPAPHERD